MKKKEDKCSCCEACKNCPLIRIENKLKDANYRFIEIHSTTSDVILSHNLMLNAARENEQLFREFDKEVEALRIG